MPTDRVLPREIGVWGAVFLGLGSMLGSGIFVAVALATQVAGRDVLIALVIAALVATANALSSAQLAAEHPVSGGTYAYGRRHLTPLAGFGAGWVFLVAKTLSAAVAAVGAASYLFRILGVSSTAWTGLAGAGLTLLLTGLVVAGLRRSVRGNAILVGITLLALVAFVAAGAARIEATGAPLLAGLEAPDAKGLRPLLYASAILFVAYAGYARIATLGEEIHDPARNIPRAIVWTVLISLFLYLGVTVVALGIMGPQAFGATLGDGAAPLEQAARAMDRPLVAGFVAVAAVTALLGVLLNLILGLSRVLLAMSRAGEMPRTFARLDRAGRSPRRAVIAVGLLIALMAGLLRIEVAWSIGAFAVLVYYGITNAAALRLPAAHRRYPRWIAWGGLIGTLTLAAFIDPRHLLVGFALLGAGLVWFAVAAWWRRREGDGLLPVAH